MLIFVIIFSRMYVTIFSRLIKILCCRGVQIRYCGYCFEQLILISVFYIPDKRLVISPKQFLSNRRIAISEAAENDNKVVCCKIVKVFHCKGIVFMKQSLSFRLLFHGEERRKVSCKSVRISISRLHKTQIGNLKCNREQM
jgi:hypothetical protein